MTGTRPARAGWVWAYAFAALIVPLIGWYELLEPFGRDQGIHATIAFGLNDGLTTYRDVFNMKPPLTTGVHWLSQALFGHSMMAIRALDLLFATLTALALVGLGRALRLGRAFGVAAAFGWAVLYYSYGFWAHAQTDGWAGMLVVPALLLMALGWARAGTARLALMAGAGAVMGLAFALKYTIGGVGILVFAPLLAGWIGRDGERFRFSDFVAVTLGGLAVLVVIGGAMAAAGAWAPFVEIQDFIRGYVAYAPDDAPGLLAEVALIGMPSTYLVLLALSGLAGAIAIWRGEGRALPLVIGGLWVGAGWVSGHVQGKGFPYHYLPMVPAYAYLIGIALAWLTGLLPRTGQRRAALALAMLALFLPSQAARTDAVALAALRTSDPAATFAGLVRKGSDFDVEANLEFAEILKARRKPGDGLFVWGYGTMLYFLAGEPPRYRYPYSWPFLLDYYDGRYTADLLERLRADPPDQFVVQVDDATPWVTYNERDSEEMLAAFPALEAFLSDNYDLVETRPRFKLYELREDRAGAAPGP
ncbi:ArnT family glycosyltransferase [Pseudooceanicola sp. LIPI14-2-Ac024]|uniref:ArnT family glycosyltransferase n=1 Tax=Pseudooceanicola sp. LIPI14-2-Ac024 TaxID=3344875 RepID=UPI0035D01C28